MRKPDHISQEDWDSVDSPPLTYKQLNSMKPIESVMPSAFIKAVQEGRVGRPPKADKKQVISLRLEPDVIEAYKATGKGWQSRISDILRQHMPH